MLNVPGPTLICSMDDVLETVKKHPGHQDDRKGHDI